MKSVIKLKKYKHLKIYELSVIIEIDFSEMELVYLSRMLTEVFLGEGSGIWL
jgi:hypothetical protein